MRLERLKRDVARATATPLELRIARAVDVARHAGARKSRVLKPKPKPSQPADRMTRASQGQIQGSLYTDSQEELRAKMKIQRQHRQRQRNVNGQDADAKPAWGAGHQHRIKGSTRVYWRRRQAFANADNVQLEFDPIVVANKRSYGKNTAIPGGLPAKKNWHVIEGRAAQEILIRQSDKRLSNAYEYLRQEEENAGKGGYPGLLPSSRSSQDGSRGSNNDAETDGGDNTNNKDDYTCDPLLTRLRVDDLIDDIYDKKEISDDYHCANDEPALTLNEFIESYFRVGFGTPGRLNDRRLAAFKRGVLWYYNESARIKDFANALGWENDLPEKENDVRSRAIGKNSDVNTGGSSVKKKVKRPVGGVVLPIPPHRLGDAALLKFEARKWLSRGRQLLEAQLKACEAEIDLVSAEMGLLTEDGNGED